MRLMQKLLLRLASGLVILMVTVVLGGWLTLRASEPRLDGSVQVAGLGAAVKIERDAAGVVTVSGIGRRDLAFALGWAHAQDRFFQMDLLRRASAGELSALLGRSTLESDRELRVHRFRDVARAALARAAPEDRAVLEAYTAGVNAGLNSLGGRPFEYWVLRTAPEPWRAEDSVLVVLTMFLQLQEADAHTKVQRGLIRDALPEPAVRFVYAATPEWEAALDGTRSAAPLAPRAEEYDLRRVGELDFGPPPRHARSRQASGSNNFALAGSRTASGAALVANDMHLGLRVPNIWYHARLRQGGTVAPFDVTGATLPGTPAVVAGSNGHVAWGFTNSYGDYQDVIAAVANPANGAEYLTAAGPRPYLRTRERILVHGAAAEEIEVVATEWGPVIGRDPAGRPLVLEWTAHDPAAVNLALVDLEQVRSVEAALAVAARAGMPAQNFVVGDADGHIAWTIAGQIPRRRGGDPSAPRLSTDADVGFDGWLTDDARPRIVDPPSGQLATANARVVGGAALAAIGDGGYDRGARAGRITADLTAAGNGLAPRDALSAQLDDSALFLDRWRTLLVGLLDAAAVAGHARRDELRTVLARWSGHAHVDDPAFRLVRAFRTEVERRAFFALIAPARAKSPGFRFLVPPSFEGPLWLLVAEQPANLLPPGFADWRAFLLAAVDGALAALDADCPQLADCTWGRANVVRIRHPLSAALPGAAALLDMPAAGLPGDNDMPRVQGTTFGASERFAVSPGHESEAYFHMPGGQSGHPLSPYFAAGHAAWAHGQPAPFLPGPAEHVLTLTP
jgi:penicillin amidase